MKNVFGSLLTLGFALATIPVAQAQTSLTDALVKHWESSKSLSLAVADAMPDAQYSFKATSGEMSFGEQMNHIASANGNYCSVASGANNPVPKKSEATKAESVKNLTASYDFCIGQIKKMSETDLMKSVGKAPRQTTAFEAFWGAFTHSAHHRGQAEVYLRLKGITPPSYTF